LEAEYKGKGLYVKGEMSTTYVVLGLGYGKKACACSPPARNASQRKFPNSPESPGQGGTRKRADRSDPFPQDFASGDCRVGNILYGWSPFCFLPFY
jgi:hypothetical protein